MPHGASKDVRFWDWTFADGVIYTYDFPVFLFKY